MDGIVKGISVIICCYNSGAKIPHTLVHLARQNVRKELAWEIIIVDNNSSDNTSQIAEREWNSHSTSVALRIVKQPVQGLINARLKGKGSAKYEFLLFCDDDNWLCENYVQDAYNTMSSDSRIGALGGKGIPNHNNAYEFPHWFHLYKHQYAIGPQGPEAGGDTTEYKRCLYGAGIIVRRSALERIENMNIDLFLTGRTGKKLTAGEDTELTYILRLLGYRLWYDPKLTFKHYLPQSRVTWSYLRRLNRALAGSNWLLEPYRQDIRSYSYLLFFQDFFSTFIILMMHLPSFLSLANAKEGDARVICVERLLGKLCAMPGFLSSRIKCVKQVNRLKGA